MTDCVHISISMNIIKLPLAVHTRHNTYSCSTQKNASPDAQAVPYLRFENLAPDTGTHLFCSPSKAQPFPSIGDIAYNCLEHRRSAGSIISHRT